MPIEFHCDQCRELLRVPDGTEGKGCKCPSCQTMLRIPGPSSSGSNEASQPIQIPCPFCQHLLACDASLLGTKGQCKKCQRVFVISQNASTAVESIHSPGYTFSCPKCDQLFEGKEEMQGRKGKCHRCGEVFSIQLNRNKGPEVAATKQNVAPKPGIDTPMRATATPVTESNQDAATNIRPNRQRKVVSSPHQRSVQNDPLSSLPSPEAGWTDLGDLGGLPMAYAPPTQRVVRRGSLPSGRDRVVYILPGIFFLIVSVLAMIASLIQGVIYSTAIAVATEKSPEAIPYIAGYLVGSVLVLSLGILEFAAGIALIRQRGLGLAKAASIVCCIPCTCFFFALPIGIWGCILLFSQKASRDFK